MGPKAVTTKSGLKYEDLVVGKGKEAKTGSSVKVHYTGWLTDGTKFDSSLDRGEPFGLSLPGQVIAGWNEGIPGMKAGGKRKLVIPSDLGYGDSGQGPIPGGATLVFEVEMISVE
ncbi:MAG: FKBP-type peptidyl-prolyl cis-trans isomerase [Armatimonadota bacterium]